MRISGSFHNGKSPNSLSSCLLSCAISIGAYFARSQSARTGSNNYVMLYVHEAAVVAVANKAVAWHSLRMFQQHRKQYFGGMVNGHLKYKMFACCGHFSVTLRHTLQSL